MAVHELYADRKRRLTRGDEVDVLQYDTLPGRLRTQLCHIFSDAIGAYYRPSGYGSVPGNNNKGWVFLCDLLRKELGVSKLNGAGNPKAEIISYISASETDDALGAIEICCRYVDRLMSKKSAYELEKLGATQQADAALEEINYRFKAADVGYAYEQGDIIRIDSQFAHAEIIKPALSLLRSPEFAGAEQEFLEAYRHFRDGNPRDAITGANRAFESTMKAICALKGWGHSENARASDLLKVLRLNSLYPAYLDKSFDQLTATLASGLPELRNKEGGHGQGVEVREVPDHVVAYALQLAATNIRYLVECALHEPR